MELISSFFNRAYFLEKYDRHCRKYNLIRLVGSLHADYSQCGGAKRRRKLPVESAQRRPIPCFEFSDFMEPSGTGCTI